MKNPASEAPPSVWNRLYEKGSNPWRSAGLTTTTRRLLSEYRNGARLLEVGCGRGDDAADIIQMGFEYYGLDIAEAAIAYAKKRNPGHGSDFISEDFFNWNSGQQFDVIYDKGFFHGLAGLRRRNSFIRRVARQLSSRGIWITVCGSADQTHEKFPRGAIYLRDLIGPAEVYFEVLEIVKDDYGLADRTKEFQAWHAAFRRY